MTAFNERRERVIYGSLDSLKEYQGFCKSLQVACEWLEHNDIHTLECGTHEIMSDKVFVNVMAPMTREPATAVYERHQRYHDLQFELEGSERFRIPFASDYVITQEYDQTDDYDLLTAGEFIEGKLDTKHFVIYPAGEPHMPTLFDGCESKAVRKVCIKLIVDELF